jgi:poly(3-hydroxybutyrate) depolymerase
MAVLMAAAYPDLFAGLGVVAGLEFKAATGVETALAAMKQGGPDPEQQGLLAYQAINENLGAKSRQRMPVIVFHGAADPYVNVLHADQVIAQWAQTNDYLDDGKDNNSVKELPATTVERLVPGGYSYRESTYSDGDGRLLMEKWIVKDLGHAWSGGPSAGPFSDPKGPNASVEMWRFFHETTADSAPPSHPTKPKTAKPQKRPQ